MNDGLALQGFRQMSKNVHATVITSTMSGAVTVGDWSFFEVISSEAAIAVVNASGITGSSRITSDVALPLGSIVGGSKTTGLRLSANSTGHKIIAYDRVILV